MMKGKKEENCVELNIYVECNNCKKHDWEESYPKYPCEKEEEEEETCVTINVFVECEKEKKSY